MQNPFPGLRPFQSDEYYLFFGRENHVKEILRKLDHFRYVAIVGNSGSGKSSLVRAGVLPALSNSKDSEWIVCTLRPGKNPVEQLAESLLKAGLAVSDSSNERDSLSILKKSKMGLIQAVRPLLPPGKKLLLLVDQFEELFRYNTDSAMLADESGAAHFVGLLLEAVGQKDLPIYVMMTIRSDFLGDCEQFEGLPEAINDGQFLIPRMKRHELQLSIQGPVDLANGKIAPRLVQQLLNEVGNNPDQLPILQHTLNRTWEVWEKENKPDEPTDLVHYEKTGGMSKALSIHAEEAFAELNTSRKRELAELFFKTITVKGSDNRGVRRPTSVGKIAQIIDATVSEVIEIANVFRRNDRGFIMPPERTPINENSIIDISHESLMRVWERLAAWVDEEAESAELYKRITNNALLYEKEMAGLWRDPDLQIALDWRQKNKPNIYWAQQFNDNFVIAQRFIDASLNHKNFELADKSRRRRITNATLITFLLILTALSIWAVSERNNSEQNARVAIEEKRKAEEQKQRAEEQTKFAENQKIKAEENEGKARTEEQKALQAKEETEKQRKLAEIKESEARLQKLIAERALIKADDSRKAAEADKQIANEQKKLAEKQKQLAEESEKYAYRMRILSVAQNMAIKSKLTDTINSDLNTKIQLALHAYNFVLKNEGNVYDPAIFEALLEAQRFAFPKSTYVHNEHQDAVKSVAFSPSGNNSLYSTGSDGLLVAAGIENFSQHKVSKKTPGGVLLDNIAFNEDGSKCVVSADNNIQIFNTTNLTTQLIQFPVVHKAEIKSILWVKDLLYTACLDLDIRIINMKTQKLESSYTCDTRPLSLAYTSVSNMLAIGGENGSIYLLKPGIDTKPVELKNTGKGRIVCLSFSNDGKSIAYGTDKGNCFLININQPEADEVAFGGHKAGITHLRFNPKNNLMVTSCLDGIVRVFNAQKPDEQPLIIKEHDLWVYDVAFSADGNYLASCGRDKSVRIYPVIPSELAKMLQTKVKRSFTKEEWIKYVGKDIPYEN